jgi:hypothetical protein
MHQRELRSGVVNPRALAEQLIGQRIDASTTADIEGIVSRHAYAVLEIDQVDDRRYVVLRNPWSWRRTGPAMP